MRVPPALRAVALFATLAGLLVLPSPSAAAAAKNKPRASVKSAKSTSKGKAKSSASKASASKASAPKAPSAAKAAFDPLAAPSTPVPAAPPATAGAPPQRGPTRIDFDDRLIQGQTNKSGAVYLYDRKELKQRSMIKKRETFREEIVGAVYDSEL
jgi:hypothetical protein